MQKYKATKEKLLAIIGDYSMDEIGVDSLLDILSAKLKGQASRIAELHRANGEEKARLYQQMESLNLEHSELRRNPASIISGPFYFVGDKGEKFVLQINRGDAIGFEVKKKNIRYAMRRISPKEWEMECH